jgi:hypothetical protein
VAHELPLAEALPMIRGDDDHRVREPAPLFEEVEELTDLVVRVQDAGVVVSADVVPVVLREKELVEGILSARVLEVEPPGARRLELPQVRLGWIVGTVDVVAMDEEEKGRSGCPWSHSSAFVQWSPIPTRTDLYSSKPSAKPNCVCR